MWGGGEVGALTWKGGTDMAGGQDPLLMPLRASPHMQNAAHKLQLAQLHPAGRGMLTY